ncbi:hypothetical protein C8R45DRAFT_921857 [Mycena sanguinolenta]|nr:hypothetical protein C8R45DRAFT_921857 [Mycena sanguinolenta]
MHPLAAELCLLVVLVDARLSPSLPSMTLPRIRPPPAFPIHSEGGDAQTERSTEGRAQRSTGWRFSHNDNDRPSRSSPSPARARARSRDRDAWISGCWISISVAVDWANTGATIAMAILVYDARPRHLERKVRLLRKSKPGFIDGTEMEMENGYTTENAFAKPPAVEQGVSGEEGGIVASDARQRAGRGGRREIVKYTNSNTERSRTRSMDPSQRW